jgi:hypothetical protein
VKSTTVARRSAAAGAKGPGPLSVPLPPDLRGRLAKEAKKRRLKLATAARVLLDEHLAAIEDAAALSAAEEWQRAQAWATWEKISAGDDDDVPLEQLEQHAARARAMIRAAAPRRR